MRILIRSEFLKFEDRDEYTTSFDNVCVWRNASYHTVWQGVCSPVCWAVYRAPDRTVNLRERREDVVDIPNPHFETIACRRI